MTFPDNIDRQQITHFYNTYNRSKTSFQQRKSIFLWLLSEYCPLRKLNSKLVIADNDMPNLRKVKHEYDFEWKDPLLIHPKFEEGQESLHFIKVYVKNTMHFCSLGLKSKFLKHLTPMSNVKNSTLSHLRKCKILFPCIDFSPPNTTIMPKLVLLNRFRIFHTFRK